MTPHLPFDAAVLLRAINGIAYISDGDGTVLGLSGGPFLSEADNRRTMTTPPTGAVGRSLFTMMHGHDVVSSYKTLHQAVWTGAMPTVEFLYRCDAPDMERHMHMSLSPVRDGDDIVAILYQSIPIEQVARVPIPLFGAEVLAARLPFMANRRIVTLCSYCHDVAWPVGATEPDAEWIAATEYYRRDGDRSVAVSHGVCPACFDRIVEPALQALSRKKGAAAESVPH